ncbi:MAG: sugar ABC transporter substrate-binding protein [Oscillospiraceae bacterium]
MNLKKITALSLTAVLALSTFASCGSKAPSTPASTPASTASQSEAKPQEPVTLKLGNWDNASDPHVDKVIEGFQALNPNIKIEMIDIPGTEYNQKLNIMLNGGSELDVFFVKDSSSTKAIFNKGQTVDLLPYATKDGVDLGQYTGLDKNFTFDGKLAGMPFRTDYYVLYYNKDIFDAAKLPYPTNDMTWKEFEATAKKLTKGEGATKTYGALLHTWQACVMNWAIQDGKHTMMETDLSFFKPYYEMALRMQNDDKSIMDYATMKTGNIHYSSPFLTGNVGMMPMGSWFIATMASKVKAGESKVNWGVATLPHGDDVPAGSVVGATTPLCINPTSKNKDAAWEFVKYATSLEGAKTIAGVGKIPAIANPETLGIVAGLDGMPEGLLEAMKYTSIVLDRPVTDKVDEVNKMLGEQHGLIMLGENDIDKGLAEMGKLSKEIQSN